MDKKTVFITGAGSGIGKATAQLFVQKGFYVGLYDVNEESLKALSKELGEENSCFKVCDISNEESTKEAFKHFGEHTNNKLNILCANAGIIFQGAFDKFNANQYNKLISVNTYGTTNTILQALPLLKATTTSRIVITSSSSGMFGIPAFAVYSATKAYLKSLTESLSTELKKYNINVNSVMPLFVQTKMMNKIDKKHKANLTPAQIAKVIFKAGTTGKKRHYLVGAGLRILDLMKRLLPTKAFQNFIKWYMKE